MKFKTFIISLSLILCLNIMLPQAAYSERLPNTNQRADAETGFFVLDSDLTKVLPDRFRIIPALNISGSAQFVPSQIENLKKAINSKNIYIVDLRQETHGFLNDIAVSKYSPYRDLNNGFSSEDTLASEMDTFNAIKKGTNINIYNKRSRLLKEVTVEKSQIEEMLVPEFKMDYILFATKDGSIPTPAVVDSFVDFIKITPPSTHLHFHCDAGEGRTTMFMAMFQMMKESSVKSLNEILREQVSAGGIVLTDELKRAEFLNDFYEYTKAEAGDNFKVPFSEWAEENSTSKF